jgi:hypothetical protein
VPVRDGTTSVQGRVPGRAEERAAEPAVEGP